VSSHGRNTFTRGTLVSASYGALFTRSQQPRVLGRRSFGTEAALDLAPVASCLSGRLARAATGPGRDVSGRRAALLALLNLRRRSAAARAFGTEGQYRLDGLPLSNKAHITRTTLAFPSNQYCENFPA
jgi:hypothetical protein